METLTLNALGDGGDLAGRHRIFFTIYPEPEATTPAIVRLTDQMRLAHGFTGPSTARARLHVSLNSLGAYAEWPDQAVARACEAAGRLRIAPFVVAFNRVASFRGMRGPLPLVLLGDEGVIGVFALHAALHRALSDAGLARGAERRIEPHITLLRDRRAVPETLIPPVRWTVQDFRLIHSPRGEGRHDSLGRWRLVA